MCACGTCRRERGAASNAQDDATCRGYGVARGTDGYVSCRNNLVQARVADDANRAEMLAAGAAMMQAGSTPAFPPAPEIWPPRREARERLWL